MEENSIYSPTAAAAAAMTADCFISTHTNPKKKKCKNKRRFSDDQIRSLETMFESETKLEPRKKVQVARDLGLHPRQVAIWFQNKRARWKSKQLERDFSLLRANYNHLASQFEGLKKEKQALLQQVQKLNDLMEKSEKESIDKGECNELNERPRVETCLDQHGLGGGGGGGVLSDDDSCCIKAGYLEFDEDPDLSNMVEAADSSLTSQENWGSLETDDFLDQNTGGDDQWWDFWS